MADNDFIGDGEVMSRDSLAKLLAAKADPAVLAAGATGPVIECKVSWVADENDGTEEQTTEVPAEEGVVIAAAPMYGGDVSPRYDDEPVAPVARPSVLFGPRGGTQPS